MQKYQYENEIELSSYPIYYTVDMAMANNDIIRRGALPYNVKRLQLFMYHYYNNIPDKVTITDYGIDGYPAISKLQYTGDGIVFTQRYYVDRSNPEERINYQTFYGHKMFDKYRIKRDRLLRDYILITNDNKEIPVFTERLYYP
jgi:hypothetical protein